jgi:hypothetical protein
LGEGRFGQIGHIEHGTYRFVVLQYVAAHMIPVGLEFLPGRRHRPHAHAVHPIPVDVFVEQPALLRLGQAAAKPFGHMDSAHKEGGVRPVEDIGVQGVVAAALLVNTLDVDVVVAYLAAGDRRAVAVENDAADRVQRPQQPRPPFPEECRVIDHGRAQLRMHVLHGSRPWPLQHAAPIPEVPPGQGIGSERNGRRVVTERRYRTAAGHPVDAIRRPVTGRPAVGRGRRARGCGAGQRARCGRMLSHYWIPW